MAMPPQLQASYLSGKVARRIKWSTPGDYSRCVRQAIKHGVPPNQARGMCQTLHKKATGLYTGDRRHTDKRKGRRKR